MMEKLESYRELFPVTNEMAYLNHAAIAPLSTRSAGAIKEVMSEMLSSGGLSYRKWMDRVDRAREACASLIGAETAEIAFLGNTSDGLGAVASSLGWRKGDKIIVSMPDFPSVIYPWLPLEGRGVETIPVHRRDGRLEPGDVEKAILPGARMLVVSAVDFLTGFACDLEAMGEICRKKGILFCVDAIQQLGALPLNVERTGIHFLSCGSHKWLMGPVGCAFLFVSRRIEDEVRPERIGWKSVKDEEDFFTFQREIKRGASGFEPGSLNILGICGLGAAVELILEVGLEAVENKLMELTGYLFERLREEGLSAVLQPEGGGRSGIVSFRPAADPVELTRLLLKKKIIVSERRGLIRVSPHFYNNTDELERFFQVMRACKG